MYFARKTLKKEVHIKLRLISYWPLIGKSLAGTVAESMYEDLERVESCYISIRVANVGADVPRMNTW